MCLLRVRPFRILLALIATLAGTDVVLLVAFGHSSTFQRQQHPVVRAVGGTLKVEADLRDPRALRAQDARASRSHPRSPLPQAHPQVVHHRVVVKVHAQLASAEEYAWAHTPFAVAVANCESGPGPHDAWHSRYIGDPHLRDGIYDGKWQMDPDFWASYGGLRFAADAADATETEQDSVAYRGYLARGWEPWECAHLV